MKCRSNCVGKRQRYPLRWLHARKQSDDEISYNDAWGSTIRFLFHIEILGFQRDYNLSNIITHQNYNNNNKKNPNNNKQTKQNSCQS